MKAPALALLTLTLFSAHAEEKGTPVTGQATGSFEVGLNPLTADAFPRLSLKKEFKGDLEGTGAGEMMHIDGTVEGSGAYVAIERVTGTLAGRKGSFALVHNGMMRRGGDFNLIIRVVPDSGTGELAGLNGTMQITIEGKNHSYKFDYELP